MPDPATMIIENAKVLTMDDDHPRAQAVAVLGNRISAVGSREDIAALKSAGAEVIDAQGGTVLPGFIESHMHLFVGAVELLNAQLAGVHGFDAVSTTIRDYAAANPDLGLIVANGADYALLEDSDRTTRHDLDRILPDRPLFVVAADHHTGWANTKALEAAGILHGRELPVGNEIVMGADGLAAGELREGEAMDPVARMSRTGGVERLGLITGGEPDPKPTGAAFAADMDVMRQGLAHCAAHGITSIHNMDGNLYQLELLDAIEGEEGLICRTEIPFHFKNFMALDALDKAEMMRDRFTGDRLWSKRVKLFIDGVLDSWTAVMLDDYPNNPGTRGDPLFEPEHFNGVIGEIDRRGFQIAIHAIGDGAVRMVLDAYEAARKANGVRDSRHRVEHIEVTTPEDIARFAKLGVIASMQPAHAPGCGFVPEPTIHTIGADKLDHAFPWRSLREAGARLAFSSDWPVSPVDPMESIQFAMTRPALAPGLKDQRQTLHEALAGYTRDGAYTGFMEDRLGMLKPGYLADIVVLGGDLEATAAEEIKMVRPAVTIGDGRVTFAA